MPTAVLRRGLWPGVMPTAVLERDRGMPMAVLQKDSGRGPCKEGCWPGVLRRVVVDGGAGGGGLPQGCRQRQRGFAQGLLRALKDRGEGGGAGNRVSPRGNPPPSAMPHGP